ncbi:hypothetical protein M5K25_026750 [Dendrobium thyrsiflorum]|uniref:Uncharacterized protein n=1 Tax=Dendrobium thyrsiflorum TaxID=117978 RepID=A0ABD0TY67_DENTH
MWTDRQIQVTSVGPIDFECLKVKKIINPLDSVQPTRAFRPSFTFDQDQLVSNDVPPREYDLISSSISMVFFVLRSHTPTLCRVLCPHRVVVKKDIGSLPEKEEWIGSLPLPEGWKEERFSAGGGRGCLCQKVGRNNGSLPEEEEFVRASPPCCGGKRRDTSGLVQCLEWETPGSGRREPISFFTIPSDGREPLSFSNLSAKQRIYVLFHPPSEGREPDTMLKNFTREPPEEMGRNLKKKKTIIALGNLVTTPAVVDQRFQGWKVAAVVGKTGALERRKRWDIDIYIIAGCDV